MNIVRSKSEKMLRICLTLVIMMGILAPPAEAAPSAPAINATGAIVMDYDTGEVYYERNADVARPAASMTKVMAAYLVFEEIAKGNLSLDTYVTASEYAAGISNNPAYSGLERLKTGGQYQVDTLLRLIFTASCNGSVVVLAEHIAGSEAAFVERMNAKATELGIDAHYADCCGFIDIGNAVSPRAMALLSQRIIQDYPIVLNYSSLKSFFFQGKTFKSTNLLLRNGSVAGIDGLKTGTTYGAGYCFTGTANQDGRRIIAVVMNTNSYNNRMIECKRLLEYGFACRAESEKTWETAGPSMKLSITASRETILPYDTTTLTATVSNLNSGVTIPCTVNWTINGNPFGKGSRFLAKEGAVTTISWVAEAGISTVTIGCTATLPNGTAINGQASFPVSQEELTFSGYLGVKRIEMYPESSVVVPCTITCDQGVELTVPVGWYLDGQPIPNFQNASFHFAPDAHSQITIKGENLTPGEHVLEFRVNTSGLPGIAQDALMSEIIILTVMDRADVFSKVDDIIPADDVSAIIVALPAETEAEGYIYALDEFKETEKTESDKLIDIIA